MTMWKLPERKRLDDRQQALRESRERKIIAARKAAGQDITVWHCFICDMPIADELRAVWVRIGEGGSHVVTDAEAEANPAGDMYSYPIGPECFRKHKAGLAPYAVKRKG
jgi:hypothetical protein